MTHSLRCGLGSVAAAAAEEGGGEADELGGPGNVNRAADCLKNRDWALGTSRHRNSPQGPRATEKRNP